MATKPICKIAGCDKASEKTGLCNMHYLRKRRGKPANAPVRAARDSRPAWIIEHLDHASDECLMWPFSRTWSGRPVSMIFQGKNTPACRIMCILAHGEPPVADMHAAHSCGHGHSGCINPSHIYWATAEENERDKVEHGTLARGERHGRSELSEADVFDIYRLKGSKSQSEIAAAYGVSKRTVGRIHHRQGWKHLWQA